jgi:radical SAM superfamily enzyme YgiQ (UPF0313 family)
VNILFIYPPFLEKRIHEEEISAVPMGLYYIGALLQSQGHQVHILNWYNTPPSPELVTDALKAHSPDIIGFSIFHANRWGGIDLARLFKQLAPSLPIVFGGIGATSIWQHLLTHFEAIDFVILGEGEQSFVALLRHVADPMSTALEDVPGIAFRKGAQPVQTDPGPCIDDLDQLPQPAQYFTFQHVALSRGCPGNCAFCGSPGFWQRRVRFHSPGYFVEQLTLLHKRGVNFFYVSDDMFTFKKKLVLEICRQIIERNLAIAWAAISHVKYVDPEILWWMRRAGCVQISYGIESGSEEIRRRLNKSIRTADIKRAFELTLQHGIMARAYIIYGSPGETRETIQASIDLLHEIKPLSAIFYILDLFPGTALYEDYLATDGATDDIWLERIEDLLYFETDPQLTREQVLAFGQTLRRDFYQHLPEFVNALQLRDDPRLYPFHADFCSRLGLTFSQGEYAYNDQIPGKAAVAEKLFRKALAYHPDHRAYLGLGMLLQKQRDIRGSMQVLEDGLRHFPTSEALAICMGLNHLNLGESQKAMALFAQFPHSPQALHYTALCYQAMGDPARAEEYFALAEKAV